MSEFRLISCTSNPVETLFAVWVQSRPMQFPAIHKFSQDAYQSSVVTASMILRIMELEVRDHMVSSPALLHDAKMEVSKMGDVFKQVIAMDIPVSECIHFTWGFEGLPIEWREQAVRKRQWGFWLTSMREFSMADFFTEGRWAPPVEGSVNEDMEAQIRGALHTCEVAYQELIADGCPQEIARKVIPLCATHNGSMFANMRALLATVASRSCWIAQLDLWGPVLEGIVAELLKVDPLLGKIVSPPCFDRYSEEFKGCKYNAINENRTTGKDPYACGKDPYACCPIWWYHNVNKGIPYEGKSVLLDNDWHSYLDECNTLESYREQGQKLLGRWMRLWKRDPFIGEFI